MVTNTCAIDFETACNDKASICAVGIARIRNDEVAETFFSLIRPPAGMEILPLFTSIHGIRNAQVRRAPSFEVLWPRVRDFIGTDALVAHNSGFDRSVLVATLRYYRIEASLPMFDCTVVRSRRAWPHLSDHKLNTVCDYLGIPLNHHEALSDAIGCAKIYIEANRG